MVSDEIYLLNQSDYWGQTKTEFFLNYQSCQVCFNGLYTSVVFDERFKNVSSQHYKMSSDGKSLHTVLEES